MTVTARAATMEDLETVVSLRVDFLGAVRGPDFRPSDVVAEHHGRTTAHLDRRGGSEPVGIASVLLWSRPPQPDLLHSTDESQALYESSGFAPKVNWMESCLSRPEGRPSGLQGHAGGAWSLLPLWLW